MTPRLLLSLPILKEVAEVYADRVDFATTQGRSLDAIRQAAQGCDGIIVRVPLPEDICSAAPTIRVIARHGAGLDMIPVAAATAARVPVVNVPGANARSVAEHGLMQMLRLSRREQTVSEMTASNRWEDAREAATGALELQGRTVGIIGLGNVGRTLARMLRAGFGMRVLGLGSGLSAPPRGVEPATLESLLMEADFVVLCVPLNNSTRGIIDTAAISRMKPGACLINLARGAVTVEAAVADALRDGSLAGAAIDVFDTQPLPDEHPFWTCPNLLITPHVAGASKSSMAAMGEGAISQCLQVLAGERPPHLVNPEIWEKRR